MAKTFRAELKGRDWVELEVSDSAPLKLRAMGCTEFLQQVREVRKLLSGKTVESLSVPEGNSHGEILIREVFLKAKGQWEYPYQHEELCHCRVIPAVKVDAAIVAGAHTTEAVSRLTSASTACGTCRHDVQKIIDFRLRGNN
ncbi:MAG: (2Fe-2S)-binding protein [Pseudobdellovibrionaceae bacterium]